jgi:prepilin-type N-terminal cleavage/methylation domain-containing protein/uncharacterized delta-60 repeat protein
MQMIKNRLNKHRSGFTITELLVVIIVISILAAITMVAYSGITRNATISSMQSDLSGGAKKLKMYLIENGSFPTSMDETPSGSRIYCPTPAGANYCIKASPNNILTYESLDSKKFTLTATNGSLSYFITENSGPVADAALDSYVMAWGGTGTEDGFSVVQTSDGGYATIGQTDSFGVGSSDMFLAKYVADGTLSWSKTWGGGNTEYGYDLVQTSDGGYAVTGITNSYGAGGYDMFIAKFTSSGTLSWNRTWGGAAYDQGRSIIQTSDGGYVVTGSTELSGAGMADTILIKYNSSGTMLWNRTWGGTGVEWGNSVIQTSDGGYAVTGDTSICSPTCSYDATLVKYASDGTLSWNRSIGGSGSDYGFSIIQTSDGGYVIAGMTYSYGAGDMDAYLVKLNSSGVMSWDKTWGGADYDFNHSVTQTSDGGYVVVGFTNTFGAGSGDSFNAKYSNTGSLIWDNTFGSYRGDDRAYGVASTSDGGFVVVGSARLEMGPGGLSDVFIAKYRPSGVVTGCSAPLCQGVAATVMTPSATVSTPTKTVTTPTATITTPSATVTSPTASTVIIAPVAPTPAPTITFSSQELYVAWPGDEQTVCKQWTVPSGTVKGFYVTQETEEDYDYFRVTLDGVEVYNGTGYYTDRYIDTSGSPGTVMNACMITDESTQDGFGGEVTGVYYN